jgi:hypothetical protein
VLRKTESSAAGKELHNGTTALCSSLERKYTMDKDLKKWVTGDKTQKVEAHPLSNHALSGRAGV